MDQRMKRELDNYITGHYGEDNVPAPKPCLTVGELEAQLKLFKMKSLPIRILLNSGDELNVVGIIFQQLREDEQPVAYYIEADYEE